jgi:hypothetical protein
VVSVADLEQDVARSIPVGFFSKFPGQDIVGSIPAALFQNFLFYMYIYIKKTMIKEISGRLFFGSVSS